MENNTALSRMDHYIQAFRDLFRENITEFDSWGTVFYDPAAAEIADLREVRTILEDFPEAARPLFREIREMPPRIEETPTLLAHICENIHWLQIPPGLWDFEEGPVLDSFRERFPQLQQEDGFGAICGAIACGLYSLVMNFHSLYLDLNGPLQPGDFSSPIRRAFPNWFAPVEAAQPEAGADTPEAGRGRNSVGGSQLDGPTPLEGAGGQPAGASAAAGGSWRLYIPTTYSRSQLERLYRGLVDGGFVEDGREEDFLLCFDPGADKQGGFVWTARGEKNRREIVIQAACDLFSLLGIRMEDFGLYVEALCLNIPTFTKSARKKARQGWSRYYDQLKEILKTIETQ